MKVKIYNNSVLATLLSLLGSGAFAIGLLALFGGDFDVGIVLILAGAVAMILAGAISAAKADKERAKQAAQMNTAQPNPVNYDAWWAQITKQYPTSLIAQDVDVMVKVYNQSPDRRKTYAFFQMLAPEMAGYLIWTCPACSRKNKLGTDCSCGRKFNWG